MADVKISVELKAADSEGRKLSHSCDQQADMTDPPHKALLIHSNSVQRQGERAGSEEIKFTLGSHVLCDWSLPKKNGDMAEVILSKISKLKVQALSLRNYAHVQLICNSK